MKNIKKLFGVHPNGVTLFAVCAFFNLSCLANAHAEHTNSLSAMAFKCTVESVRSTLVEVKGGQLRDGERVRVALLEFDAQLGKFRSELVQVLASSNQANFDRCVAAYYLGRLRAAEACAELSANIGLRYNPNEAAMLKVMLLDPLPAQRALVQIGQPAIAWLVQNIGNFEDATTRRLSLEAILEIEADRDIARLRIQKAMASEVDVEKKSRYKLALDELEALPAVRPPPWRRVDAQ